MRPVFLIDTDTASDDAVALILALQSTAIAVEAITVVAGNVNVGQAARNALYTAELSGSDVPVHIGADRPLRRPYEHAEWFHGRDGLGDHGFAPARRRPHPKPALDALHDAIRAHPGLTLVTLGPLTNVAALLTRHPDLAALVGRCVLMGGAPCCEGNVTPAAEYNIWADPDAARVVLRSGMPIDLVGWQLSRSDAILNPADIDEILALSTPLARFAIECNSRAREAYRVQTGEDGISLPDPICMALALNPALSLASGTHRVDVETDSDLTRGMTVVDRLDVAADGRNRAVWQPLLGHPPSTRVHWSLDVAGWKALLKTSLAAPVRRS